MKQEATTETLPPVTVKWNVMCGKPCIAGTRIPVWVLRCRLMAGETLADLALDYELPLRQLKRAMDYADTHYPMEREG
jgi:uncharacterized protein (DUF433 family)